MILVTVGMQLGFDRLLSAMDALQPAIGIEFIAQVGASRFVPINMRVRKQMSPSEFEQLARRSALMVSHAGIGTVLLARKLGKPIVLLPRRASLGEHRNDHQLATALQLKDRRGIFIADDEYGLPSAVSQGLACGNVEHPPSPTIIDLRGAISNFIADGIGR